MASSYLGLVEALQRILLAVPTLAMGFQKIRVDEFQVAENSTIIIELVAPVRCDSEHNDDERANKERSPRNGHIKTVKAALEKARRATAEEAHGAKRRHDQKDRSD
jgi:hypothetical protein